MMSRPTQVLLVAASVLALAMTPALADKGKAKGQGKSNGGQHGQSDKKAVADTASASAKLSKGALASELKGLNAAHASANAMENASPNSRVGRIALYRDAALVTQEKAALLEQAKAELDLLAEPTRSIEEIDAAIAGLDPLAPDYADALAALEAEKDAAEAYIEAVGLVEAAQAEVDGAAAIEDEALLIASDGRILSDEALAYLRSLLNL